MPRFADFDYGNHFDRLRKRTLFGAELKWKPDTPRTAIEIGCREGSSTLWFLTNLLQAEASRIYCIDPWDEKPEYLENFDANIAEHPGRHKVTKIRARSYDALMRLLREDIKVDFAYVDGSHFASDVLWDMMLAFKLLCVGGVMMCDDYSWTPPGKGILGSPKVAIDAFTTVHANKIRWVRVSSIFQLAFKKSSD